MAVNQCIVSFTNILVINAQCYFYELTDHVVVSLQIFLLGLYPQVHPYSTSILHQATSHLAHFHSSSSSFLMKFSNEDSAGQSLNALILVAAIRILLPPSHTSTLNVKLMGKNKLPNFLHCIFNSPYEWTIKCLMSAVFIFSFQIA